MDMSSLKATLGILVAGLMLSGCIRMTNEDVIDLYSRIKMGTLVVVLEPKHGDSPYNSKMALQGGGNAMMQ